MQEVSRDERVEASPGAAARAAVLPGRPTRGETAGFASVTVQWQLFDALDADAYAALKADIRERGVLVPVEYDDDGQILDGHHRVRAFEELKAEGVALPDYPRIVRMGLDDAAKRRHVIALNLYRRHLTPAQRAPFLAELREYGLTLREIAATVGVSVRTVGRDLANDAGVASATPATVRGKDGKRYPTKQRPRQLAKGALATGARQMQMAIDAARSVDVDALPGGVVPVDHRVLHAAGKATREARRAAEPIEPSAPTVLPADVTLAVADARRLPLPIAHVDLIVTSPPYGLGKAYDGGDVEADAWPAFMADWLAEAFRVARPSARLAVNVPLDTARPAFRATYAQTVAAAQGAGWTYRSTIVWADRELGKSTARGSVDSASSPSIIAPVEMVALFSRGDWKRQSERVSDLAHADWLAWTNGLWLMRGEPSPWEHHPAPFPVALPRRLLLLLSFPGDVVLDPFVGSGTTALAAYRLGRRVIGFDTSIRCIASARRRLARCVEGSEDAREAAP